MKSIKIYEKYIILIGDKMKYFTVFYRSTFFYILVTIVYKIMGKRELGELSVVDFIVSIFIAELASISIENYKSSMFLSIIPIITLVLLEVTSSYITMKNKSIRKKIDGNPSIIIEQGKINFEEMKKQRYNIDDLLMQLRNNSIKSIEEVDYAVLETSGKLSIFKKQDDPKSLYPLPIIVDCQIQDNVLRKINKNEQWLKKELEKENINISNIFYAFYKEENLYIIENNKIK